MAKAKAQTKAKPKRRERIHEPKEAGKMVHVPKQLLVQPPRPLTPQPIIKQYSGEQVDIMKQTVAKGTTDMEFKWFLYVAKEIGLSPLRKQIHAVKRWNKKVGQEEMTIQTGIDGFRAVADSTGTYAPSERQPEAKYDDKNNLFSVTMWGKKFIRADRSWHEFSATALWDEFVPLEVKDGEKKVPFMWAKMPYNQLEKCAEAKMLRRGWPEKFSGVYVHEEMARTDAEAGFNQGEPGTGDGGVPVVTREQLEAEKRTRERATLEPGKEANRGHGNEGLEEHGPRPGTRAIPPDQKKKEQREEAKQAKLETIGTWIEKVEPMLSKLTPKQENENKKALAKKEKPKHEPRPYMLITTSDNMMLYAWSSHVFPAVMRSKGKDVIWKIERRKTDQREFLSVVEIVNQAGVPFIIDPETKDFVPATSARTQAPSSPDRGESAPVQESVENDFKSTVIPPKESVFGK